MNAPLITSVQHLQAGDAIVNPATGSTFHVARIERTVDCVTLHSLSGSLHFDYGTGLERL